MEYLRDTIIEVNLDNLAYNMNKIKNLVGDNVSIAAVVKANGYGHGAVGIAKTLMDNGADFLAVATLTEAIELRKHFDNYPIFIMGYTPNEHLKHIVTNNFVQTIFSLEQATILNKLAKDMNTSARIQIKYDTGFNRLGFKDCDESIDEISNISKLPNIICEGIFSHFALKNEDTDLKQYTDFTSALDKLSSRGINFKYKHICDSIAAVDYPQYRLNMIRPGAIIYGLKSYLDDSFELKPILSFKTKISYIKKLKIGEGVSYSFGWKAQRDSIIGTVPFGYADGYPRNMKNKGYVTVNGKKAPIIGVICMDQCMIDLTDIPEAVIGDTAIIYGSGENTMSIEEASQLAETNKNEIIARLTRRSPRVYIKNGEILEIKDYLID